MDNHDSEDLKARIQELEDELQKLKEQKRQDGTDSAAVNEEIEEVHDQIRDEAENSGMSRRKFMKAIAGGGAALGAAAMMPSAAALDIESTNPLSYNSNFEVDTQGNVNLQDNNITNAGSINASSVMTTADNGDDTSVRVAPLLEAVHNGYIIGSGTNYITLIDPENYASDADALQAAVDELATNSVQGNIHFGPQNPDGSIRTIDKSVQFAKNGLAIYPLGHGFGTQSLDCAITDGSPMFIIGEEDDTHSGANIPLGGFSASANGNDAEAIRFHRAVHWRLDNLYLNDFAGGANSDGVIVIDSGCFTWEIDNFTWLFGPNSADVVKLVDQNTDNSIKEPGHGVLCEGFEVNGDCNTALTSTCPNPPVQFEGYIEEPNGPASIYFPDGSGSLIITPCSSFGGTSQDHVFFNGQKMAAYPGYVINAGRHVFNIGSNAAVFKITPFNRLGSQPGDDIHIEAGAGTHSNKSVIPFESQLNGTITAPTGQEIVYPHGKALVSEKSGVTHTTGSDTVVYIGVGGAFEDEFIEAEAAASSLDQVSSDWAIETHMINQTDPSDDMRVILEWVRDPGTDMEFDIKVWSTIENK